MSLDSNYNKMSSVELDMLVASGIMNCESASVDGKAVCTCEDQQHNLSGELPHFSQNLEYAKALVPRFTEITNISSVDLCYLADIGEWKVVAFLETQVICENPARGLVVFMLVAIERRVENETRNI